MFVLSLLYMSRVFVLFVTNFTISKNKLFEKIFKNKYGFKRFKLLLYLHKFKINIGVNNNSRQ